MIRVVRPETVTNVSDVSRVIHTLEIMCVADRQCVLSMIGVLVHACDPAKKRGVCPD